MKKEQQLLILNIQASSNNFSASQKTIANYLMNNSEDFLNHDIASLSKKLFVSKATISRFAQKIGYSGFREMYFDFEKAIRNDDIIVEEEIGSITDLFVSNYKNLIDYLKIVTDEQTLIEICNVIDASNRCFIIGISTSGLVAEDLSQRLCRIGYNAHGIRDNHFMRMQASLSNKNDIFIAFSSSGETKDIVLTLQKAKGNGAKSVLITEFYNSPAANLADYIILTPPKNSVTLSKSISDQLPLILLADLLYHYLFQKNYTSKNDMFSATLIKDTDE